MAFRVRKVSGALEKRIPESVIFVSIERFRKIQLVLLRKVLVHIRQTFEMESVVFNSRISTVVT